MPVCTGMTVVGHHHQCLNQLGYRKQGNHIRHSRSSGHPLESNYSKMDTRLHGHDDCRSFPRRARIHWRAATPKWMPVCTGMTIAGHSRSSGNPVENTFHRMDARLHGYDGGLSSSQREESTSDLLL